MDVRRILHTGRVVHHNGRPAAGAFVWVATGTAPTPEIAVVSDEKGYFRLALPPGHFEIRARSEGGQEGKAEATAGEEPLHIEIEVSAPD
ncbi:carboxypeptidase-like regulatory domain-containing protein [Neorhizobium huautlense]|uniref:carboxypeptidase-like regulatory domain-containing protein n=1 Tax=Neorhizobium huautlense TaxID=67774 RepID=UPI000CF92D8B|nr:carboxypeptidase-like regulatory domain-containing protein [Neorhizobium huautlense]